MTFHPVKNTVLLLTQIILLQLCTEIIAYYTNLKSHVYSPNPVNKTGGFFRVKAGRI